MTASPLEARCSVCLDTGSKSQDIDDFLNCTSCDAAERRMEMQNYISGLSPLMSNWAKCWVAYNLGMRRPAAPVAAQRGIHCQEFHELAMDYRAAPAFTGAPAAYKALCDYVSARLVPQPATPKLPSTPLEVTSFIGDKFDEWKSADSVEDYRYTVSVHDLLSAFRNLADFAEVAAPPADPDDMAANYDHSTHDKRMEVLKGLGAAQPVEVAGRWLPTVENINTLPDGVRHYVHDLVARCDPAGDVARMTLSKDACDGLQIMYRKATDVLEEIKGCFNAAEVEGLTDALAETTDERLKDLVQRRLMYALYAAQSVGAAPQAAAHPSDNVARKDADWIAQEAACWRLFQRVLRTGHIPGAAHGRRFKIIETCAMSGDEKEFNDFIGTIAAIAKEKA